MKATNLFSITLCILLICNSASAQITGVRGGINIANLLDKDNDYVYSDEYSSRIGINLGLTLAIPISDNLHFETGAFYANKGFIYDFEEIYDYSLFEMNVKVKTQHIDIPLTLKSIYKLGKQQIYITYGLYAGIGVSGKMEISAKYRGDSESESVNILWGSDDQDDFRGFDFGLIGGAGVNLSGFVLEARYELGLANIAPNDDNGAVYRNRVITVMIGFPLSKNTEDEKKKEYHFLE